MDPREEQELQAKVAELSVLPDIVTRLLARVTALEAMTPVVVTYAGSASRVVNVSK